jgi:hypothetical protein
VKQARRNRPTPAEFSAYLRSEREASSLTLAEISRITKVPRPSLERIERAAFDELPADVFVRGFLRSYAQCVGLDPEDVVRRYADCRDAKPPVPIEVDEDGDAAAVDVDPKSDALPNEPALLKVEPVTSDRDAPTTVSRLRATGSFITRQLFEDRSPESEQSSRKGAVTLAVIILVIVATLTMSYLLRRPSSSGDGVTNIDDIVEPSDAQLG